MSQPIYAPSSRPFAKEDSFSVFSIAVSISVLRAFRCFLKKSHDITCKNDWTNVWQLQQIVFHYSVFATERHFSKNGIDVRRTRVFPRDNQSPVKEKEIRPTCSPHFIHTNSDATSCITFSSLSFVERVAEVSPVLSSASFVCRLVVWLAMNPKRAVDVWGMINYVSATRTK